MKGETGSLRYYFDVNPLAMKIDRRRRLALFLDFDGTLVPIRKNPAHCYLSPMTRGLIESILASGRSAVTLISGRSLADLRKRASLPGVFYAGSHGLEISGPGIRFVHEKARLARPVIDALYRELTEETACWEGVLVEKKPFSCAVHYRAAADEIIPSLRKSFRAKVEAQPDHRLLTVLRGKKVLEVVPQAAWSKAEAALRIMERLGGRYLPVCLGDDRTDETLFEAFREKGITIRVGSSRKTLARYYLKGQREVHLLLGQICEVLT